MTIYAAACTTRSTRSNRSIGWVPFALVALVVVPAIAGSLRLVELAGGPALCLTLFYPRQLGIGALAYVFRLVFGSGMAASIILGLTAIRRRDIVRHRAWMTRAYALALGAGTQVFTQGIGKALFGPSELTTDLCLGAGWVINLAVAEYGIRRSARRRAIISRPAINSRSIRATAKVGSS